MSVDFKILDLFSGAGGFSYGMEKNPHFIEYTFTVAEQELAQTRKNPAVFYATRFAAKEAVVKMLGFGFNKGVSWQDIEILPNDLGKPVLTLFNGALRVFTDLRLHHADISISHTTEFATAICVAEE